MFEIAGLSTVQWLLTEGNIEILEFNTLSRKTQYYYLLWHL